MGYRFSDLLWDGEVKQIDNFAAHATAVDRRFDFADEDELNLAIFEDTSLAEAYLEAKTRLVEKQFDTLGVYLGSSCNMDCSYCMRDDDAYPSRYDARKFRASVSEFHKSPINRVIFAGGEPLLKIAQIKDCYDTICDTLGYRPQNEEPRSRATRYQGQFSSVGLIAPHPLTPAVNCEESTRRD